MELWKGKRQDRQDSWHAHVDMEHEDANRARTQTGCKIACEEEAEGAGRCRKSEEVSSESRSAMYRSLLRSFLGTSKRTKTEDASNQDRGTVGSWISKGVRSLTLLHSDSVGRERNADCCWAG